MKPKENSLNQNLYNQISKKGIRENDKKLLIKKLGFNNLSHSNLNEEKILTKKKNLLIANSLSSLKIESKKPLKPPSIINLNINLNKNLKNNHTISNQRTKNKSLIKNYNISSNSLSKNSTKNKTMNRNNKSMASLPTNPVLNINGISDFSLNKLNKVLSNEAKNNNISSINSTTAQNSIKTNQNINSNVDLLDISSNIKPIRKIKSKPRINTHNNTSSTPNLLIKVKKSIINNKEKPYKIIDRNLYNDYKNKFQDKKSKDNFVNKTPNKKVHKSNKNKINKQLNNTAQNISNKNQKIFSSLEKLCNNENKNDSKDKQKYNHTLSNDNSDETKKESCLNINKVFNDKLLEDIDKKNIINGIITNNMKISSNDKNLSRNNNNQNINEQITLEVENNNNQIKNKIEDNEEYKYISTQKLSLSHIDINMKNEFKNIIKKYSNSLSNSGNNNNNNNDSMNNNIFNCEEDEKDGIINNNHNKDGQNKINYSDINSNENAHNNNLSEYYNNNDEYSSIKTRKNNMYKKLCDLNNVQEMSKQEAQEIQGEQENKSGQTQTTVDKNNIISKFMKQPMYNISPRFLINEISLNTKLNLPSKSFMFINDIEKENKNLPILDYKKILTLNDKSIYNLLSYTYDNYSSIISVNKLIKNKINNSLKNIFKHVLDDFQSKYNNFLKVLDYSFVHKSFILNHKKSHLFNMEIKCQIITLEPKKSYEIGCNYISFNKKYDYIWKFDVINEKDIKLWLCTELDIINNSYKKFTYTSQVASFSYNDEIKLQLNIFSKGNNIDPISIEWTEPVESSIPSAIYEKSTFKSAVEFDQLRACEVESQILFWKNTLPKEGEELIDDFKKIFEKFFKIRNIYFDESKFYFFKIEMKANKIGLLKKNKYSTFDLNIIDCKSNIKNEIQCIYLMNSNYYTKKMDIRIGTLVTLYIVDMKR